MIKQFISEDGIIIPAVTKEQMVEVDRIAVEETGPNLYQMMENVGRNLALEIIELLQSKSLGKRVLIFAGTGGNGGGGIGAGRHLLNHGYDSTLVLLNENKLQEVPAYQLKIFIAAGGTVVPFNRIAESKPDVIVDSLIGYSLNSSPGGIVLEMINFINNENVPVVALDIPTGILATTGENPGEFIKADKTLTLALPKTGLLPSKCGKIILADIGIPKAVYSKLGLKYISPFRDNYRIPVSAVE